MAKKKIKRRRNYVHVESPKKIFNQMTRDHTDVLQNIEAAIVCACRDHDDIDDRTIALALKYTIHASEPADQLSAVLVNDLEQTRQMRAPVPDDIWIKGLKVILQSVHTHSNIKPGDKVYLAFIRNFVI